MSACIRVRRTIQRQDTMLLSQPIVLNLCIDLRTLVKTVVGRGNVGDRQSRGQHQQRLAGSLVAVGVVSSLSHAFVVFDRMHGQIAPLSMRALQQT